MSGAERVVGGTRPDGQSFRRKNRREVNSVYKPVFGKENRVDGGNFPFLVQKGKGLRPQSFRDNTIIIYKFV